MTPLPARTFPLLLLQKQPPQGTSTPSPGLRRRLSLPSWCHADAARTTACTLPLHMGLNDTTPVCQLTLDTGGISQVDPAQPQSSCSRLARATHTILA